MFLFYGSVTVLILIFLPFVFWGRKFVQAYRQLPLRGQVTVALILAWQVTQLVIQYPGLISFDDLHLWETLLRTQEPSTTQSIFYSFITNAWSWVMPAPHHLSLINLAFFAPVVLMSVRLLPAIPLWSLLGLGLIFSMPQSSALVLFQNRDSLYSILFIWLSLGLLAQRTPEKGQPWFQPWVLIILSFVLAEMRQEGKFLLVLMPLLLWWLQQKSWLNLVRTYALVGLGTLLFIFLPSPYNSLYKSTAIINPLSNVFSVLGPDAATKDQQERIEKFIPISELITHYTPHDIGPFHAGVAKDGVTDDEFRDFQLAALEVLWAHKEIVLQHRGIFVLRMMNFNGSPLMFINERPTDSKIAAYHYQFLSKVSYGLPSPLRFLFSSLFVPLTLLILSLGFYRAYPEIFAIATLHLVRLAIFLVLAPASYFKYISSSWIVGWFLLLYLFVKSCKNI